MNRSCICQISEAFRRYIRYRNFSEDIRYQKFSEDIRYQISEVFRRYQISESFSLISCKKKRTQTSRSPPSRYFFQPTSPIYRRQNKSEKTQIANVFKRKRKEFERERLRGNKFWGHEQATKSLLDVCWAKTKYHTPSVGRY